MGDFHGIFSRISHGELWGNAVKFQGLPRDLEELLTLVVVVVVTRGDKQRLHMSSADRIE